MTISSADHPRITIPDFLEVLSAMHFSRLVPSPIQDASGLMLVAPSGSLKSQLLMHIQRLYPTTCICDSNWHYGKLLNMKAAFYNGTIRSIVIPELASLYAGDPRTGGRMESMLQQMAGEGSVSTNEKDSRWERYEMRATIFGALTPEFAGRKHQFWEEGFHRRFLWAHLAMENEEILLDYLSAGKQADLYIPAIIEPPERYIPDVLDFNDKMFIRSMLASQKDFGPNHTRFVFLCRTCSVLKWHYSRIDHRRNWRETLRRFSVCLSNRAALLVVPDEPDTVKFRKIEEKRLIGNQNDLRREKVPQKRDRTAPRNLPTTRNPVSRTPPGNHRHKSNGIAKKTPAIVKPGKVGNFPPVSKQSDSQTPLDTGLEPVTQVTEVISTSAPKSAKLVSGGKTK